MQWEIWHLWTAAALTMFILEVFVPGFVLACLGIGAAGAAIAAAADATIEWQLLTAAVTSLLAFVFLRPVFLRMGFSGNEAMTGVEALVGRVALITHPFDPITGLGRCQVDGDNWRAILEHKEGIPQTTTTKNVEILRVESNTIIVRYIQ